MVSVDDPVTVFDNVGFGGSTTFRGAVGTVLGRELARVIAQTKKAGTSDADIETSFQRGNSTAPSIKPRHRPTLSLPTVAEATTREPWFRLP
jgi:hypothetical protein